MQQRKSFREEDPAVVVGSALGVIVMIALGAAFFPVPAHGKANTAADAAHEGAARSARGPAPRRSARSRSRRSRAHRSRRSCRRPPSPVRRRAAPPLLRGEHEPPVAAHRVRSRAARRVIGHSPDDITSFLSMTMSAPPLHRRARARCPRRPPRRRASSSPALRTHTTASHACFRAFALVPDHTVVTSTSTGSGAAPGTTGGGGGVQFNISAAIKGAPAPPPLPP